MISLIMPLTSVQSRGHIGLGLSICLSIHPSVYPSGCPLHVAFGEERLEIGS